MPLGSFNEHALNTGHLPGSREQKWQDENGPDVAELVTQTPRGRTPGQRRQVDAECEPQIRFPLSFSSHVRKSEKADAQKQAKLIILVTRFI